ncbi:MAG: hypothetical protein Tsb0020_17050 [Haliangiales bacterium]
MKPKPSQSHTVTETSGAHEGDRDEPSGLRFGAFELDLAGETLRKSGVRIKVQAQPLKVLTLLALRAGSLVTREEIQAQVWPPGTHVDFDQGINACIKAIRGALGDRAIAPRFVETVPRRGYRFVAPVERLLPVASAAEQVAVSADVDAEADSPAGVDAEAAPITPMRVGVASEVQKAWQHRRSGRALAKRGPRSWAQRWPAMLAVFGALAASGALAVSLMAMSRGDRSAAEQDAPLATADRDPSSHLRAEDPAATPARQRPVLAVLPFATLGPSSGDDYFGDALAAELISQLSRRQAEQLGVIAYTSAKRYRDTAAPVSEIAATLGADYVLEGTVRRAGDTVRVTAQLIQPATAQPMWAGSFDRETADVLAAQGELAETLLHALALELSPSAPPQRPQPGAYEAYLEGRYHLHQRQPDSADTAAARFSAAIAIDPDFAAARAGLAHAQLRRPLPADERARLARQAAEAALTRDHSLAEAHLAMALVYFYHDWNLEAARAAFERALAFNPGYAQAHHAFAGYYSVTGQHQRALAAVERARALDPLSPMVNADIGWYYYFARQYQRAAAHCRRTLTLAPGFYWAHRCIIRAHLAAGEPAAAARAAQAELREQGAPEADLDQVTETSAQAALRAYWRWDLARKQADPRPSISPANRALAHLALDQRGQALDRLEDAVEQRSGWLVPFLRVDPFFDPLRDEPRFQALLARIEAASIGSATAGLAATPANAAR